MSMTTSFIVCLGLSPPLQAWNSWDNLRAVSQVGCDIVSRLVVVILRGVALHPPGGISFGFLFLQMPSTFSSIRHTRALLHHADGRIPASFQHADGRANEAQLGMRVLVRGRRVHASLPPLSPLRLRRGAHAMERAQVALLLVREREQQRDAFAPRTQLRPLPPRTCASRPRTSCISSACRWGGDDEAHRRLDEDREARRQRWECRWRWRWPLRLVPSRSAHPPSPSSRSRPRSHLRPPLAPHLAPRPRDADSIWCGAGHAGSKLRRYAYALAHSQRWRSAGAGTVCICATQVGGHGAGVYMAYGAHHARVLALAQVVVLSRRRVFYVDRRARLRGSGITFVLDAHSRAAEVVMEKCGSDTCHVRVAFKSESVTPGFVEKSHPAGLTRSYLNTCTLIDPVDCFIVPLHFYHIFALPDLECRPQNGSQVEVYNPLHWVWYWGSEWIQLASVETSQVQESVFDTASMTGSKRATVGERKQMISQHTQTVAKCRLNGLIQSEVHWEHKCSKNICIQSRMHKSREAGTVDVHEHLLGSAQITFNRQEDHYPEGTLYYNDLDSFTGDRVVKYKIYQVTVTEKHNNSTLLVHINFYHQTEDTRHAEFLALDPAGTVTTADMDDHTCDTGKWQDLDICYATAMIRKYDDDTPITVAVKSLNNSTATIEDKSIEFFAREIGWSHRIQTKLGDGICANWNNDRVVFYHDDVWTTDFNPLNIQQKHWASKWQTL
ncbi:hypothetical protein B0H13DRAFT_1857351 [Mycena leptocephala]|nr:hypothetical protein B0H13DRAFT_1857351 [Mycena leptocephala]